MGTQHSSTALVFGPFEVNVQTGELRKQGLRVRLSGQPFQILLILLAKPGDLITRDELRAELWSDGTFVDFEHGLNAAINKLRRGLSDSAEQPRYIETLPGRGYRFIGVLEQKSESVRVRDPVAAPAGPVLEEPSENRRQAGRRWLTLAMAVCLGVGLAVASQFYDSSDRTLPWTITRLTADSGISDDPALSPDGTLVAYSSDTNLAADRGFPPGALDLYVKHVAGGAPIRLTFDGAGNRTPDFSPDGSRIVFRTSRDGGGIYEMPALGGDARLIARHGFNPRYSPDGTRVAYWVGPRSVATAVPGSGTTWVVPVEGGEPQRVAPGFTSARYPIWHRDGTHLLISGYASTKAFDTSAIDWWVVATDGSSAVRTGPVRRPGQRWLASEGRPRTPIPSVPEPRCWSTPGDKVAFAIPGDGESWNLWELEVSSRTGKVVGSPRRLTTGPGGDMRPSCAGSALAFAKVDTHADIWLLPFDLNRGTPTGTPERMTLGPPWHETPWLAQSGGLIAFSSDRSGPSNIWLRELETGRELSLAASSSVQRFPVINASGTRIAFSTYEKNERVLWVSTPGGAPERVCDSCLRATDWSQDEKTLVVYGGNPYQINALDLASRRQTPLVKHDAYGVIYGRLSPDNRWISFTARVQPDRGRIVVAPTDGPRPSPESAWVTIADVAPDDYANWSPDGKTLYFTSGQDGYSCLWAQQIDATSRRPVGQPFAVQHFHGRRSFEYGGWSAAAGRIAIPLVERTGNVWMMSRTGSKPD